MKMLLLERRRRAVRQTCVCTVYTEAGKLIRFVRAVITEIIIRGKTRRLVCVFAATGDIKS